jgi:hypothetical protein
MSRATNSFHHIKAHAEGVDANQRSDALRVAIADAITVLATALDGSVALGFPSFFAATTASAHGMLAGIVSPRCVLIV